MIRLVAWLSLIGVNSSLVVSAINEILMECWLFIGQKGDNADIVLWDYTTKRAIFRLSEHDYEVSHLDFSHDDRLLISTGSQLDGKAFIWDTQNGFIVSSIQVIP